VGTVRSSWLDGRPDLGVRFLTQLARIFGGKSERKPYTEYQQAMPFETKQIEPGITVVTIAGTLVLGRRDLDLLEATVRNLLEQDQKNIVFDLAALNYADSSGMGVLISCFTQIKNSGGALRLVGTTPRIQKLFRLARVDDLLSAYSTVAKATGG